MKNKNRFLIVNLVKSQPCMYCKEKVNKYLCIFDVGDYQPHKKYPDVPLYGGHPACVERFLKNLVERHEKNIGRFKKALREFKTNKNVSQRIKEQKSLMLKNKGFLYYKKRDINDMQNYINRLDREVQKEKKNPGIPGTEDFLKDIISGKEKELEELKKSKV